MQGYFQQLNQYYDKIYVLSVEAAAIRRELFAQHFKGLEYSFFFGADKNKFTIEETIEKNIFSAELTRKHHRYGKTMKPGEIACAWSHKMMYEEIIKNNYTRVLIFEDDAVPDENNMKQVVEILREIPATCELLLWGWGKNGDRTFFGQIKQLLYHIQHFTGQLKWNHRIIRNLYARPFSKHLKKAGFHDFTYAYAISRSGAEKLLQMQTPIQYVADNLLAHAATNEVLDSYITSPKIFLHDTLPDGTARDSYIR
jgi:glycosyl transferase, family 25